VSEVFKSSTGRKLSPLRRGEGGELLGLLDLASGEAYLPTSIRGLDPVSRRAHLRDAGQSAAGLVFTGGRFFLPVSYLVEHQPWRADELRKFAEAMRQLTAFTNATTKP
jgi:hypothetical protein